jgi:hypothetical protein
MELYLPFQFGVRLFRNVALKPGLVMLLWLASFPRSGNTFFRVLLKQLYGLSSFDLHQPHPPFRPQFKHMIGEAVLDLPPSELARDGRLHIVKTHELPQEDYPAIYLVRDGRDAIASYARFLLDSGYYGSGADYPSVLRRLIESSESYGGCAYQTQVRHCTCPFRIQEPDNLKIIDAPIIVMLGAIGPHLELLQTTQAALHEGANALSIFDIEGFSLERRSK